ncbi:uncharacterized protein PpBr36_09963, partial [Pyricularia pennisetigena]|uniref:uncharacterized protein n=1 Tax=Pyricularia pennisetigena TaxID=1578925 RepID=UPI001150B9BE
YPSFLTTVHTDPTTSNRQNVVLRPDPGCRRTSSRPRPWGCDFLSDWRCHLPGLRGLLSRFVPYDPIMNPADSKMRCNGGRGADLVAPVAAGTNITAFWKQWTHAQGPVMVWAFKCSGAHSQCTGDGKGWFKIDQMGLWGSNLNSENWGTATVLKTGKWSSKIPSNLKAGNYLIRHELLALHQANTPQFYPECANIEVTGSGTDLPPDNYMYSIPTYAPMSDPGVRVDIYQGGLTSYSPPGGSVWPGFK